MNDLNKPVAYDAEGKPLYHHPPEEVKNVQPADKVDSHVTTRPETIEGQNFNPQLRSQYANEPKVVHAERPLEPELFEISDDLKIKHELSKQKYPFLNLSEGEYVILDIKRHPIGLLRPILVTTALLMVIFSAIVAYPSTSIASLGFLFPASTLLFLMLLFALLVALAGAVSIWVYLQNHFFMTNESVVQQIQDSLLSRHEQTVSLGSIEDASFRQTGILQTALNYGTIRLSTEGEETTYIFHYVNQPKNRLLFLTMLLRPLRMVVQ